MSRAIREHLRDFLAILVLIVLAAVTTGVILAKQGASLPNWLPVVGSDHFELKAEFSSAQAVTPGQGQTVVIAGIKVGSVSGVNLEHGDAVITMQVDNKYAPLIHPDASLLLRPRSGLQDMTIEVDPGSKGGEVEEGSTLPLADTQPNVQPDQVLASLDGDTQSFLQLLLQGASTGLQHSPKLSSGLRRFEPTARALAEIGGALAKRRQNIQRVITNFGLLMKELGKKDTQLAGFVRSSNDVLASFARQEASIRGTIRELPAALHETQGALESFPPHPPGWTRASRTSTCCSTRSPTTRPGPPRRATCSSSAGSTTTRTRSSSPRTRAVRCGTASCSCPAAPRTWRTPSPMQTTS